MYLRPALNGIAVRIWMITGDCRAALRWNRTIRYYVVNYINIDTMKKVTPLSVVLVLVMTFSISASPAVAQTPTGMYAEVQSNHKRFIIQIVPDKTYEKVVAYVNFYGKDNKRIAQRAYSITDEKEKYMRKGVCATRVFKISVDGDVARVKIDHVNEGEILKDENGDNSGKKIALPVASAPLEPISK